MGFTLDQLLDETGARDLAGGHTKTAAPAAAGKPSFAKLAERCRRAAETVSEEKVAASKIAAEAAAAAIITRTLEEIAAIGDGSVKLAAPAAPPPPARPDMAVFIKTALESGHSAAQVASFIEKNAGLFDRIGRGVEELGATMHTGRAAKSLGKAQESLAHAGRKWQSLARKYENLGDVDKAKFIEKLRTKLGDESAHQILQAAPGFHKMPGYKDLDRVRAAASQAVKSTAQAGKDGISVGGHQVVSGKQLKAAKGPAAMLGAGALGYRALANRGDGDDKKKGVVVVNS